PRQNGVDEVATQTVRCLRYAVPAAIAGIVFLSGEQAAVTATAHLNAMHCLEPRLPWPLSFSYGRALQDPALKAWAGRAANAAAAQQALAHRSRCNGLASLGQYSPDMERAA
ncbi:MAG: class I fructose-bisphosphate aldolase, partial [Gammaproteobacteria bacterium]